MVDQRKDRKPEVDVVIPVYGERAEALAATLSACVAQTCSIASIFVVDDGSLAPVVLPAWAPISAQILPPRLPENLGISGARNAAIARSNSLFPASANTE